MTKQIMGRYTKLTYCNTFNSFDKKDNGMYGSVLPGGP